MTRPLFRAAALACSAAVVGALALPASAVASVDSPAFIDPTAGATQINLVGFNDFHGRILDAERFGATVIDAENRFGAANTLVVSNGDAVSASVFESAIQKDEPTINALNALGVEIFTVGNHEFDHGAADAIGRIQTETAGPDLAANVTLSSDGSHPFEEYATFTVAGVTVGVIGAVTAETPSLSAPDAVSSVKFGDPVDAVNRVAKQLKDGDPANGEADILIASYHEGGPLSDVPLSENEASAVFKKIVQETDPSVSAIYTAHTHRTYAYDAPVPGSNTTRPVVQAGSYGENIGQIVLTLGADGAVSASASSVIPTYKKDAIPADIADDPRLVEIRQIVDDAVTESDVLGSEVVGLQSGDFSRAKQYEEGSITVDAATQVATGTVITEDDRANASSLSDMVAQSMVDVVNARGNQHADLALMNPGGVRADILDDDGKITYKEAATVVPFANDLNVVTVTTEVLKKTLEQQWQRTEDGAVPSRPYLQLGLSDAFTYVYDSSRDEGDRIVSMSLDGEPMAAGATWNVAMSSFLAGGGDNFRALKEASDNVSVGIIDTDAFPAWFRQVSGEPGTVLKVDNRRNGIEVRWLPVQTMAKALADDATTDVFLGCEANEFDVAGFDLASLGYIQNDEVTAEVVIGDTTTAVGSATVTEADTARLNLTVPEGISGEGVLRLTAGPSESVATLPVTVDCPKATTPTPTPTVTPTTSPSPTPTGPTPTDTATAAPTPTKTSGALPATGADGQSALLIGGIAAAVIIAGVIVFIVARRRSSN